MAASIRHVVTGAFGFTGAAIARRLLAAGRQVVTLTNHPDARHQLAPLVPALPLDFDQPDALAAALEGAVLYNTWWIRFERGGLTFDRAVERSRALIAAAARAGVRRVVHLSITNPALDSPLPYFRGKAEVEQAVIESGLPYAILRPAVIFGERGILINNIAWFLRHLPVFGIPGDGEYRLQPIFVDDLAELAVEQGRRRRNVVLDAVGPERLTFNSLVALLRLAVSSRTVLVHVPPAVAYAATRALGRWLGDVVLTWDEVAGLLDNLLVSDRPPTGHTRLSVWVGENLRWLGREYQSEVKRHYR